MPRMLLDADRRIRDHAPGSVNPARWTQVLLDHPTWFAETVAAYPGTFHVGHFLSIDGTTATALHDLHVVSKVETRRHKVENWAAAVANNLSVYREALMGTPMALAFLDYRAMMLSAAMTDANLSTDTVWDIIDEALVSYATFLSWEHTPWSATAVRTAMRNGRTFYEAESFFSDIDRTTALYRPRANSRVAMTALTPQARANL